MRVPKIIVSKCLDYQKCRYDGQGYNEEIISLLKNHANIHTVCPETEIGLETPRKALRIEEDGNILKLVQHKTNLDYSSHMNKFSEDFIDRLEDVDGFILKSKSPSCGIKDVKIYHKDNKCSIRSNGDGLFTSKILEKYSYLPIENEGRLKNYSIRDSFFTKIFLINKLKCCDNLQNFHKENLLLLSSYEENLTKELSSIVKFDSITDIDRENYKNIFYDILKNNRNKEKKLETILLMFKRYKKKLDNEEIAMFNELVKSYKNEKIPFNTLAIAIRMYATRFKDTDLLHQSFFNPYPESLISICDSGKGRDL